MDASLTFSDEEIKEELSRLGYDNIPHDKLAEFQRDLNQLVQAERSKSHSANSSFGSGGAAGACAAAMSEHQDGPSAGLDSGCKGSGRQWLPHTDLPHVPLTSKELAEHEQRQQQEVRPAVPGHFSLYELRCSKVNSSRDDVSQTDSEIRQIKRKTLRKNEEGAKFIDESMSDIDAGSIIDAHERMQRLVLRDLDPVAPRRAQSALTSNEPPPYRLSPNDPRLPSVIYSSMEHPHTKNLRRADPVARYHQMRQAWNVQRAPGEKQHKGLRWNIREQMLTQFVPDKKSQRRYVENNYIPPTEKPRKALRWQIRMDMAQGTLPVSGV